MLTLDCPWPNLWHAGMVGAVVLSSLVQLFLTLVHQRFKLRRSIVVTSNRVVQD